MRKLFLRSVIPLALLVSAGTAGIVAASGSSAASESQHSNHVVSIPKIDRFTPYQLTIHEGDTVTWVNNDTDNHTVVSDDAFDTAGLGGLDHTIVGTEANHGRPGTFRVRFDQAGTFVYYCRFHSHLNSEHQPIAPGPRGGIQDTNGNFGTPMSGVITVMPDN
jgi:plastocyanin